MRWKAPALVSLVFLSAACSDGAGRPDGGLPMVDAAMADAMLDAEPTIDAPDTTPPTFAGAAGTASPTAGTIDVTWNPATDLGTLHEQMRYHVCVTATSGGCDGGSFTAATTVTGVTQATVTGLEPLTPYHFVVRAEDELANTDLNDVEVTGTTLADLTPPMFGGITQATTTSGSTVQVDWNAASDDTTSQAMLVYDIYYSTTSGGQNFGAAPQATSAAGTTSHVVIGLMPLTTYYFVVRARDLSGNRETNTVEAQATLQAESNPPTGGTITTASFGSSCSTAGITWTAATDDVTPQNQITYDICYSTSVTGCQGGNFFVSISQVGGTSRNITGLSVETTYYFVVRARDQAGNRNTNNTQLDARREITQPPIWQGGDPNATVLYGNPAARVSLDWADATPECAGVEVDYRVTTTPASQTSTALGSSLTVTTGLEQDTIYSFQVRAFDQYGNEEAGTHSSPMVRTGSSFAAVLQPLFTNTCSACHSWSYASTVNQGSSCNGLQLINDSSATESHLYLKLVGNQACGNRMPNGGPYLTTAQTDAIARWIDQGAHDN